MRYEFSEFEWAAIKPMRPNKPRGVPRVNDRRVLNGKFRSATGFCVSLGGPDISHIAEFRAAAAACRSRR
jgi:hypothetical protein